MQTIRSVAVLGAGTMGAQIAAQVANAGWPVLLLDLDADTAARGLKHAAALKPDPFFTKDVRPHPARRVDTTCPQRQIRTQSGRHCVRVRS